MPGWASDPLSLTAVAGLLGAIVGSFLNVVILRLPRMLEARWRRDACEFLQLPDDQAAPRLTLAHPASHCPHCGAPIRAWHNIPILSWLLLRGRAACCGARISAQYPLVEALSAVLAAACAWHFGYGWALAGSLVFSWMLLALAVIDLNTQLLPDDLTLPLLWLGLLGATAGVFSTPTAAIVGAAAGYLSLWTVASLFRLLRGREGMAPGDFKLLAAIGAWLGWHALPEVILLSSLVGAVVGSLLMVLRRQDRSQPIPFGPYLAGAGWLAMLWGDSLREAYLRSAGLGG